jgi:hypothetical protein
LPWTCQQSGTGSQGQPITTTVTDPMGNATVHTLIPQSGYCALYETKRRITTRGASPGWENRRAGPARRLQEKRAFLGLLFEALGYF